MQFQKVSELLRHPPVFISLSKKVVMFICSAKLIFQQSNSLFVQIQIPSIDTDDEHMHTLLVDSFLSAGRVSSVTAVMSIHPQYLEWFLRTEFYVMQGEGPLPFDWRHYIAIMVRSLYHQHYLYPSAMADIPLNSSLHTSIHTSLPGIVNPGAILTTDIFYVLGCN